MRRRDLLILFILAGIIFYSWRQLQPPAINEGQLTVGDEILAVLSPWHGPIERAQAEEIVGGSVKGESPAALTAAPTAPQSVLPVETYEGAPLLYSLEAMLKDLGVTLDSEDIAQVFPDPKLGIGSAIHIYRATPVEVSDWHKVKTYRTWKTTVGDFLAEQNIELGDNDRLEPAVKTTLSGSTKLTITRVAITEVKQRESIDFKKLSKEDPDLPRGQTKVTKGVPGVHEKTLRLTRENGVEVKREKIKDEVTRQPQDELTIVGTKVLIGQSFTGPASWYKFDSTKIASDLFKRGTNLRITNLDNGKMIWVKSDGCICSDTNYVVDLHPDYFRQLGGLLSQGVMPHIKVDEVLN